MKQIKMTSGSSWAHLFVLVFTGLLLSSCGLEESTTRSDPSTYNPLTVPGTQIGVLVSFDGNHRTFPLEYLDTQVLGIQTLADLGLAYEVADFGGGLGFAVCSIDGIGEPAGNCFGDEEEYFWAVYVRRYGDSGWETAQEGLSGFELEDGDIIAFLWTQYVEGPAGSITVEEPIAVSLVDIFGADPE